MYEKIVIDGTVISPISTYLHKHSKATQASIIVNPVGIISTVISNLKPKHPQFCPKEHNRSI